MSLVRSFDSRTPAAAVMNHRRAWKTGPQSYRVIGRRGNRYSVRIVAGVPRCDCEAGRRILPCWHAAATLRRLIREGVA
jgi:hypothetical protein